MASLLVAAALLSAASAIPLAPATLIGDGSRCGYKSCPATEPGALNVHIVPHTHDDVGWLKTVDQYYYGSKNNIQKAGVQYILDSVIKELWTDPKRRFIYVETAFFWKWWQRQHDSIRHKVHKLVSEGRLEFIGGAWSMNDEADTHYQSTIDQFTWGLRKLNETFGECGRPRVGWQIDPFGHSRELASLLAAMGYDGLFHGRIDYQDKATRLRGRSMEMLWRGDDDLGAASDLFTGVLYNTYSPPPGFCFDVLCQDEPIIDDPRSPMHNVDKRAKSFMVRVAEMHRAYASNYVLVTMGDDFSYQAAELWFGSMDKLIEYVNLKAAKDNVKIKLFYSTPSCYLKAVHDAKPKLPTKQDDFFPYASDPNSYWTGYFTSRPTLKYFERRGNTYLQIAKQLQVLGQLEEHNRFVIDELRSAMGVMQHHDAVTGTEKQHVADDYARILDEAIEGSLTVARQAISNMTESGPGEVSRLELARCQLNISQCAVSERSRRLVVTVYNPLAWSVGGAVRLPVTGDRYTVRDPRGAAVESQMVALPPQLLEVRARSSSASRELVFAAEALPALGYRSYYVSEEGGARARREAPLELHLPAEYYGETPESERRNRAALASIARYLASRTDDQLRGTYVSEKVWTPSGSYDELRPSDLTYMDDAVEAVGLPPAPFPEEELEAARRESERRLRAYGAAVGGGGAREAGAPRGLVPMSAAEERMLADALMLVDAPSEDDFIENEHMRVNLDRTTGEFTSIVLRDGTAVSFDVDLMSYPAWVGDNASPARRSSGAYIFRPSADRPAALASGNATVVKGPIVQEVHHRYANFSSSVTRLYRGSDVLEFEWLVGPIPVGDKRGKEIIVRYHTNVSNRGVFYTDSNGRQSLKRILNKRPQWDVNIHEPIAGNYYPVTSKIYIEDPADGVRFTVLNDRAQGGSSLEDGQLELMVHRRLLNDDAFGVDEALDEEAYGQGLVARGKHYISVGKISGNTTRFERRKEVEVLLSPEVLVSSAENISFDSWIWLKNEWSGIKKRLPEGVHLLTLEPWKGGSVLLRLEHLYGKGDFPAGANGTLSVDVATLFANLEVRSMREASLAANQWWEDRKPLAWERESDFGDSFNGMYGNDTARPAAVEVEQSPRVATGFIVDLEPKEIRTFVVEFHAV